MKVLVGASLKYCEYRCTMYIEVNIWGAYSSHQHLTPGLNMTDDPHLEMHFQ